MSTIKNYFLDRPALIYLTLGLALIIGVGALLTFTGEAKALSGPNIPGLNSQPTVNPLSEGYTPVFIDGVCTSSPINPCGGIPDGSDPNAGGGRQDPNQLGGNPNGTDPNAGGGTNP